MEKRKTVKRYKIAAIESIKCSRCGRKTDLDGDFYDSLEEYVELNESNCICKYCTAPLINMCSDNACATLNLPQARFCKRCGKETLFKQNGVFDERFCRKIRKLVRERYGSARGTGVRGTGRKGGLFDYLEEQHFGPSAGVFTEKYPDWLQKRIIKPGMLDDVYGGPDERDEEVWESLMRYYGCRNSKS